jgi:CheY-like chemotaxis protein
MSADSIKTVLIVDNDKAVREVLARTVKRMGHQMVEVERATRAIEILTDRTVDAMLLDLHMPGPQGQDLLQFLRKRNMTVPPTIVVSGYLNKEP